MIMRKNCTTCKHDRLKTPICDECYHTSDAPTKWEAAEHYKPDTNADRIRAMSDNELAEDYCKTLLKVMQYFGIKNTGILEDAVRVRLEWLKQPAEGE
jgi:hypothetical protein